MDATKRMQMILNAPPAMLAKIDAVLLGDETHVPKQDPDCRTCTLTEAARRMGVSRPTIYRMIKSKKILTAELNGVSRVVLQSLFNHVANCERISDHDAEGREG